MTTRIFDYSKICDEIKGLDPLIRFAGVINPRGRLVAGGMKEGVAPLETQKDDEMLFMELALRVRMRQEFDAQLGKVRFAMSLREKVLALSFPIKEDVLYVVAETNADFKTLAEKILDIIKNA